MDKKIVRIILILVIVCVVLISIMYATRWFAQEIYEDVSNMTPPGPEVPSVTYDVDKAAGTITITSIEGNSDELVWSNVELLESYLDFNATLPTGTIDEGDVITDCEGPVALVWKPSGAIFYPRNIRLIC